MGWLFSREWPTKQALIDHLVAPQGCTHTLPGFAGGVGGWTKGSFKTVEHSISGNHLWAVVDIEYPDHPEFNARFIALYLLSSGDADGWGYKDLEETMGPCEADCPLRFLDLVPEPDPEKHPYAKGWRDKVRAFHAGKRERASVTKTIKPGQRWMLVPGCNVEWVTIVGKAPQRGQWYANTPSGTNVRVMTKLLARQMGTKEVTASEFFAGQIPPNTRVVA